MKFDALEEILEEDGIVFLTYGGFLTQSLIAGMTDALEKEVSSNDLSMKIANNIFTIFIELSQNMMAYAKSKAGEAFDAKGMIIVGLNPSKSDYYIIGRNLVDAEDKKRIEARLEDVEGMDREGLRQLYRERRKSGRDKHTRGAGIGFIEIARRSDSLEHHFVPAGGERYYFIVKVTIGHQ